MSQPDAVTPTSDDDLPSRGRIDTFSATLGRLGPWANLSAVALIGLMLYQHQQAGFQMQTLDRQMFAKEVEAVRFDNGEKIERILRRMDQAEDITRARIQIMIDQQKAIAALLEEIKTIRKPTGDGGV